MTPVLAFLLALAAKSLLVAGITLLLLRLAAHRSAAERSWLAHAGLVAVLLLPLAPLTGLGWRVQAPAAMSELVAEAPVETAVAQRSAATLPVPADLVMHAAPAQAPARPADAGWYVAAAYAAVAVALLLGTLAAVFRLVGLRRRAQVLVAQHWIGALARAQNRMGFKHGTALLVSDDLGSPVSWGLLRPVIVLNRAAVAAEAEAEAIIAHELAHVARLDWAKLMLSRLATAIFWFNPLVWRLAGHCHQLREEAADDAVLGADVGRIDYAKLLVGVARHEAPVRLAANGVASGADSLKRRVARVLDAGLSRAPARTGWVAACAAGALVAAVPLAAVTLQAPPRPPAPPVAPVPPKPPKAPAVPAVPAAPPAAPRPPQPDVRLPRLPAAPVAPEPLAEAEADDGEFTFAAYEAEADAAEPISGVSVRGGGTVILRHGRTEGVRVLRGAPGTYRITRRNGSVQLVGCLKQCPGGAAEIEVTVANTSDIALATVGGGSISARGSFPPQVDLAAATVGGGSIDAVAIPAGEVAAAIRGGGTIRVAPRSELAASISGGGTIAYTGNPEVASQVRGGGSVQRLSPPR